MERINENDKMINISFTLHLNMYEYKLLIAALDQEQKDIKDIIGYRKLLSKVLSIKK